MQDKVWEPNNPQASTLWQFMQYVAQRHHLACTDYPTLHQWSITQPALFWESIAAFFAVPWDSPAQEILNDYDHMLDAKWFTGARFNFAKTLLSRRDHHLALVSLDENNRRVTYTYQELFKAVAQCAAGLRAAGVGKGEIVCAVMPNTAHTVIAMLATSAVGAVWSSCSPDFGAAAIVDRFAPAHPKLLFACDGHQYQGKQFPATEKLKRCVDAMPSLTQVVICPNIGQPVEDLPKALRWDDFIKPATTCDFLSLPFDSPLYLLFSSGTTGKPKGIVHGAGGTLLQHLKELGLHTDITAQDNLLFYTTCGWMMWHWMVSALALGATLTLYEGSPTYPHNDHLLDVVAQEKVTVFGTSAKYLSAMEKLGLHPNETLDFTHLRCLLSTGSPLLPPSYDFVYAHMKADLQLSSISGGTDIVSCFALGNPLLPVMRGELQCLGLGMAVEVFDVQGNSVHTQRGELVCTKPFPSMPLGFLNDPNKSAYKNAYFARFHGVWTHGDFAEITRYHGLIIYGRSDAVLNPGGVRIGTAEIYRQVEKIPAVMDCVVIGQQWQGDERVVLFVVLTEGRPLDASLKALIRNTIKENTSPRHVPAKILQVPAVPRTLNGKLMELAVKHVVHDEPVENIHALANPEALEYFKHREELYD